MSTSVKRAKRLTRDESAARTRARLLDAAEVIFAEHGFGDASLEHIAGHAGYTRGALYANFASKADLFLAVLDRWLDTDIERGTQLNADSETAHDALERLREFDGNRFADRQRFLLLTEFRLYALRHPELAHRLADYERRSINWYADAIRQRARQTELPIDADHLGMLVLALENGIATLAHLDPDNIEHHAFIDALSMFATILNRTPATAHSATSRLSAG